MLRSGLLLAVLALVASPVLGSSRMLLSGHTQALSGKAIVISREVQGQAPQSMLGVRTPDGRRVHVEVADERLLAGLHTGMHIKLTGAWARQPPQQPHRSLLQAPAAPAARKFVAASLSASGAAFAAPTMTRGGSSSGGMASIAAVPTGPTVVRSSNQLAASDVSTLFVPIAAADITRTACPGTMLPRSTTDQVRQAVFEEANPSGITVGSTYNKCSYGKAQLTRNNSLVADLVELPCQGTTFDVSWSFQTCEFDDFNGYADAADEVLRARGIDLSLYKHKVYLIPPGACQFVGLGYVGCDGSFDCRSWIGADFWASPAAMAHEIGHNLFLGHAGAANAAGSYDEYADLTGVMGYCCSDRCPNTPHAWQLGWVNVEQLDGTSLKPGQTVTTIVASQSVLARSGLRIVPSWAAGVDPVFVGYRTKAGGDLASYAAGKVQIYTAPITNTFDPRPTTWQAALETQGQAWQHPTSGLVVRLLLAGPISVRVTVCRRGGAETLASCQAGTDNDCNGLVGARDPACVVLRRRVAATLVPRTKAIP